MLRLFCILLAIIVLLAGCSNNGDATELEQSEQPPSKTLTPPQSQLPMQQSSSPQDPPSPAPAPPDEPIFFELEVPGMATIYTFRVDSGIYEVCGVPLDDDGDTLMNIAAAVGEQLGVEIPIKSVTLREVTLMVVDLDGSFADSYSETETRRILVSLAATLDQNVKTSYRKQIQFQLNGEEGVFGQTYGDPLFKESYYYYEVPHFKFVSSPVELAAIRASIPYEGLQESHLLLDKIYNPILDTDETGKQLIRYLAMLRLFKEDVASLAEIDNQQVVEAAVFATKSYTTISRFENYTPELKPFEALTTEERHYPEDTFYLEEHVEQSAKLLFGDNFAIEHEAFYGGHYHYIEPLGIYTPPQYGEYDVVVPVIFDYEDLGDSYRIELAYLLAGIGYSDPDDGPAILFWEEDEEELRQYVLTKSRRREVVVKKAGNGRFIFESHRYLQSGRDWR